MRAPAHNLRGLQCLLAVALAPEPLVHHVCAVDVRHIVAIDVCGRHRGVSGVQHRHFVVTTSIVDRDGCRNVAAPTGVHRGSGEATTQEMTAPVV